MRLNVRRSPLSICSLDRAKKSVVKGDRISGKMINHKGTAFGREKNSLLSSFLRSRLCSWVYQPDLSQNLFLYYDLYAPAAPVLGGIGCQIDSHKGCQVAWSDEWTQTGRNESLPNARHDATCMVVFCKYLQRSY